LVDLRLSAIRDYLASFEKQPVRIVGVEEFRKPKKRRPVARLKGFGFGTPYLVEYTVRGGKKKSAVFGTMSRGGFGHDFPCDRAHSLLLAHSTFNRLPKHVRSLDVGIFTKGGELRSVGDFSEFFILLEKVEGEGYYRDLERIRDTGALTRLDLRRCTALSEYVARVHKVKKNAPELYVRRARDLLGHGECIMGLIDSYPKETDYLGENELEVIEKKCVDWRWKLKNKFRPLRRVHGDFHPFNVMFREGTDFTVLDRSRGEWGEPADDVACMSINYILFSLQAHGALVGPFERLYELFMNDYMDRTGDDELLEVIQPFYAWRSLVLANPIWYPTLSSDNRRRFFNFIHAVLDSNSFDVRAVNSYLTRT
jgi:aminoglycoside phosphotransferase (APT) family kinase protein